MKTVDKPCQLKFHAEKSAFLLDDNKGGYRLELQPQTKHYGKQGASGFAIEKVVKFECVSWGESHGAFLDRRGRIYTCGDSRDGRLGLPDKALPAFVKKPT